MNAQAYGQLYTSLLRQMGIELTHGLYHAQSGSHSPLRVILMPPG